MDDGVDTCTQSEKKKYIILDFNETEWFRFISKYTSLEICSILECNKYNVQLCLGTTFTIKTTNKMDNFENEKELYTDKWGRKVFNYLYVKNLRNTINYDLFLETNNFIHCQSVIFIEFNNFIYNEKNIKNFFYSLKKFHSK